jgi:hypothetical protein
VGESIFLLKPFFQALLTLSVCLVRLMALWRTDALDLRLLLLQGDGMIACIAE